MSHAEKSAYYQELKAAGVEFPKRYQEYTTEELKQAVDYLRQETGAPNPVPTYGTPYGTPDAAIDTTSFQQQGLRQDRVPSPPQSEYRAPDTEAGLRMNSEDAPRRDENGLLWYKDEIRKPPYPKARKRRVLKYIDPGVKMQTVRVGDYLESFEVSGDEQREAEVRITLPSYQVGCYSDPRFPFRIHIYNEARGFDLFEVQNFYGGSELVPEEIKRVYVENVLCYDIRTTVRAIETEARQIELAAGKRN